MGILGLQIHQYLSYLAILVIVVASFDTSSLAATTPPDFSIAKPNCSDRCGNVRIPFPFGTTTSCSLSEEFLITCNRSFNPPKTFFAGSTIEIITDISLDGHLRVLNSIAHDCYDRNGTSTPGSTATSSINLFPFTVNNTANKITIVGCDTYGYVTWESGHMARRMGCCAMCEVEDEVQQGSCKGSGCCEIPIPRRVQTPLIKLVSHSNNKYVWDFNDCGYAFAAEESAFTFSPENLTNLKNVEKLPLVVDWAIGNGTCEEAQKNSSTYACRSVNSKCYMPTNGYGYRCSCQEGYQGNPYLVHGCKEIDECQDPSLNNCEKQKHCVNIPGGFHCFCPQGYIGDGKRDGRGCFRLQSIAFKLVAVVALGVIVLLVPSCWLDMALKRRRLIKMRRKFFLQNGGHLLQERLARRDKSSVSARVFTASELQKATNNFHNSMIIGRGGFGTVYKGRLPDNVIVAIKKSKEVDPRQIEQFINEVIVLSQINHRNVVKLLGCCLETQAPLLVFEFINNGTLSEHIHNRSHACSLSWDMRLRIATETAGVLSYLHSAASTPIIHRDVKSSNILLGHNFTAKVSDFGASRLFPLDQTQLTTIVQGTFGYLDPEYMLTSQLTQKSDVYSFGVVLVELLTGRKAVSNDRPEGERSLASFFLEAMKQDRLFQVVEGNFMREENKEQLMKVAAIAENCLKVKGDERPIMKEVAMELEGLIVGDRQIVLHTQHNNESLLDNNFNGCIKIEGNCTCVSVDSISHSMLSTGVGR